MTVTIQKQGELAAVMAKVQKEKPGTLFVGSSIPQVRRLATGVYEFDSATGGGFPYGRISIVYGPESSGKTNICLCAAATAQREPEVNKVIWVDLEGTFDPKWARQFGVDTDQLIVVKPSYGEEAVDIVDALIRAGDVALIVVDSVAAMVSSKEVGQSVETMDVQGISTLVKRLTNKLAIALSEESKRQHTPAVIYVNQTRFKIGVMFGDPETMPGGQTMKFLSSLTVRLYGKNKMVPAVSSEIPVFKETKMVIKKSKVPILRIETDYELCMKPHGDMKVGDTNSFNGVKSSLQTMGALIKAKAGWELILPTGEILFYPTLAPLQDRYIADASFRIQLQQYIIQAQQETMVLVEQPKEEAYDGPKQKAA